MIQLWFLVLFAEGALATLLLVRIEPFWGLVMNGLDQAKTGRGPATAKTVAATVAFMLLAHYVSIAKLQNKGSKLGTMTPMDQVLWRTHLLDASLLGFCLFLGFIIVGIHHYLRKLTMLEGNMEKLEKEKLAEKEKEEEGAKELKRLQKELSTLRVNLTKAKLESQEKDKRVETAEAHVASLQKQSADLLLEYDRLLEENQNLQSLRA